MLQNPIFNATDEALEFKYEAGVSQTNFENEKITDGTFSINSTLQLDIFGTETVKSNMKIDLNGEMEKKIELKTNVFGSPVSSVIILKHK